MMWDLFLSAFITLFVVIDPPGCAPIYAGLVKGATHRQATAMAVRATVIAALILLVFALFGEDLLGALHELRASASEDRLEAELARGTSVKGLRRAIDRIVHLAEALEAARCAAY